MKRRTFDPKAVANIIVEAQRLGISHAALIRHAGEIARQQPDNENRTIHGRLQQALEALSEGIQQS